MSIKFTVSWYMGGVYNKIVYGETYSLKTGKKLKILDVVKKKNAKVGKLRDLIYDKLMAKYDYEIADTFWDNYSTSKTIKNLKFHINYKGNVVVLFSPYEIAPGSMGTLSVTVPSRF